MLEITVRTERGERYVRPAAGTLARLVRGLGDEGNRFLVVRRVPDLPTEFAQVWREDGGDFELEHRNGGPATHVRTRLGSAESVAVALTGWARRDADWAAGLAWRRVELPPVPEVPPLELPAEDAAALEERLRETLRCGYADRDQLAEQAEDFLVRGDERPVSGRQARALADRLWLERVAEQAGWEGETDPERIERAFRKLAFGGITAREHFTCCRSCGNAEIGGVSPPDARGFVYFHQQSTEGAANGGQLSLYYGRFDGSEETTAAVGREVVAALTEEGLTVEWNGSPSAAIAVTGLDWRRRLVG
ncbi:hypothetical protein FH609_019820 [Streptomyces sp. 3MP-14]|uniref:DUF6891 domain-containing protein n=1 Tax=Streptomyces mimosae TaxID=2586635 RepID=A0A5N5ZQX2_9ACTN|nr:MULTISPECIES: hypothetical protein [Streptomyces]KAB8158914.1 hypothetical protein FH607_028880 [Streptomyces mimosae]KAB8174846.1 hypothetical protein FH609_019820 [Streptomyces sp. 3MP-14]